MATEKSPGYNAAHMRVRRAKGRAALHMCVRDCGRRAYDWAFTGPDGGFSMDPDDYVAMCRTCHRALDAASHGEGHHNAKLTDSSVREIRRRHSSGESQRALAREFGVSQPAVLQVVSHRTWKHVQPQLSKETTP